MSALRVLGDERALGLAGAEAAPAAGPAVHLGAPATEPAPGDVVWLAGPACEPAAGGVRLVATCGDALWARAPWPVRDELFGLAPAGEPSALVVCADDERRATVVEKLEARGRPVAAASLLSAGELARASVVALLGEADAPTPASAWSARSMPAEAPAVLAARRLLVAPRCEVTFGLLPGADHLAFGTEDDVVAYIDAVLTFPAAFELLPALGALAAERHRASVVYARLAADLAAG